MPSNPEHMKEDLGAWFGRLPNPQQRHKIRELWDASYLLDVCRVVKRATS